MNPPEILQIPIEDIIPNRFQPRISFDEKALNELAQSIKQHGIIQPLVVRKLGDKYEIIAGERRYKASTIAGLTSVPAIITQIDDRKSAEVALVENIQRKNLTPIEEARSYKNLIDKNDLTQEELAKKMGVSQSSIANKLRLLNLSPRIQDALLNEKISERHARSLLVVDDFEEQNHWLDKILNERLTVRQLDNLLKKDQIDEEDVPLVNVNQTIDDIKNNATDILNLKKDENLVVEEKIDNNFIRELEDEPVTMSTNSFFNTTDISNFKILSEEEVKPTEQVTPKVFEDIEMLDFDIPKLVENEELNESINSEEQSNNYLDIIKELRNKITDLNINKNITIEEIDLDRSYQINITIDKNE